MSEKTQISNPKAQLLIRGSCDTRRTAPGMKVLEKRGRRQ